MTDTHSQSRRRRWRIILWAAAVSLWLLPLLAMQFTDEVDWTSFDFVVFGAMLALAGGMLDLGMRRSPDGAYRLAVGLAVIAAFLLVWVNGAVGIIGNENNPANMLFIGVPAIALIGALLTSGRPGGMFITMIVAAASQALVPLAAAGLASGASALRPEVGLLTAFFCTLWLVAAMLFRTAASQTG